MGPGPMYGPMRGPPPPGAGGPMPPLSMGGPGTPIMPSPGPGPEPDPLYMMKNVPSTIPSDNVGGGGNLTPGNNNGNPGDNGVNGDTLDNMKQSPGTAPATPRDSGGGSEPLPDFNLPNFPAPGNSNESEAILKIKESMQEEAKRFEKDSEGGSGGG